MAQRWGKAGMPVVTVLGKRLKVKFLHGLGIN